MSVPSLHGEYTDLLIILYWNMYRRNLPSYYSPEIVNLPESVVVFTDSVAEFTCETSNALFFSWIVNGTHFNQLESAVRDDLNMDQMEVEENELYTLNITSRAEYNGTVVQCLASRYNQYRTSENATLMIQGNWGYYMYGIVSTE